ncbi:MAG TPA: three-Cys-motif partner protein TcmP [Candidatus Limnocylindrales bacterium]|nr:three-Cys-motif partner protein TcmP [Candidatus Limnocylindrales bacterium]
MAVWGGGVRVASNEDFFITKKAAAVFKHGILSRYPVVFAAKAGMKVPGHRVSFLDGYAGRGCYDDGQPGSPLLLVASAERVDKFRAVRPIFVERDDDNFANLSRVLAERGGAGKPVLYHQSLDECLPQILELVKDDALFAFLDPFGPALDFELLRSGLLGRPPRPPTEVLLHFSVLSVARMGGALRKAQASGAPLTAAELKSAQRLDRFLGGSWWQQHFAAVADVRDQQRATAAAMSVADRYRDMITKGTGFMSVSMPVRPRPDLLPKYVLVLFTRHVEGVWQFADCLGKAGADWRKACTAQAWQRTASPVPGQLDLFGLEAIVADADPDQQPGRQQWVATIAANIWTLARRVGPFRIADRVTQVYGTTLGSAWIPHVRAAVADLYRRGLILNDPKGAFQYSLIRRCQPHPGWHSDAPLPSTR